MARPSQRDSLLDAAEDVVLEAGAARLTLDAVAARAGVSKGGLLYHFPSKEALLAGMVERLVETFRARRQEALEEAPDVPTRALHAHLMLYCRIEPRHRRLGIALLAVVANEPSLLGPLRERIATDLDATFEGIDDVTGAAILFLAAEGMAKLDLLGLNPFDATQRGAILAELVRRAGAIR